MAKASPILSAFNSGQFSETLSGRTDFQKYSSGCDTLENFIPLIQGPAARRGGTRYVAAVKSGKAWLIKFEFSVTQSYILEFGNLYVRFYTGHGQVTAGAAPAYSGATAYVPGDVVSNAGVYYYCIANTTGNAPPNATYWYAMSNGILEIPSPYALSDLTNADGSCALSVQQSGDVLYIANQYQTYAPRKLTRLSALKWVFTTYDPTGGPTGEQNATAVTLQASAGTGSVTITASSATFTANDVGRLIRMESEDITVKPWASATAYGVGNLVRSDGKTYIALNAATSGNYIPSQLYGAAYDGGSGVNWDYQNAGYGVLKITAYTDSTHVTATVQTNQDSGLLTLPADVVSAATTRWSLGEWYAGNYPSCVGFFRNRLAWAGGIGLWLSVPNSFDDMSADFFNEITDDCAIWTACQELDGNNIVWIKATEKLIIGSPGGEFALAEVSTSSPLSPSNYRIDLQSKRRTRSVPPIIADDSLCFVQTAGKKLFSFGYSIEVERYAAGDLAVLANRLTKAGIVQIAYQNEPFSIIWCVLSNGTLLGFTYDKNQDVTGWHVHPIGGNGFIESIAIIPNTLGTADDVWLSVKRTINSSTVRYVEYLSEIWEAGDGVEKMVYMDSAKVYEDHLTTTVTTLSHLEGETVQVLVNGAVYPDQVVTSGTITLDAVYRTIVVGKTCPAKLVTNRLEAGNESGTAQGKTKRINRITIRLLDTLGGFVGLKDGQLDEINYRDSSMDMDLPPSVFTGDKDFSFPGIYETGAQIEIQQTQALPMTIVAIMPDMKSYDR